MRAPGPDHPITISRNTNRVVVRSGDRVVADTRKALMLRESSYPTVQYVPRDDVDMTQLRRSDHVTVRPYKGQAAYFNLPVLEARGRNAVWTFEAPYPAVAEIAGHLAFYPGRVTISEEA